MYTHAVASSVMLQLYIRHGFYNIIFKIERKIYILRVSPLTQLKIMSAHLLDMFIELHSAALQDITLFKATAVRNQILTK
jgi:hypothetical protein